MISFTGCTHLSKYGIDTKKNVLEDRFNPVVLNYKDYISDRHWNDASTVGFISNPLDNSKIFCDPFSNNNLEKGLGYIFFNTLLYTLEEKKFSWINYDPNKHVTKLPEYIDENGKINIICPLPWKYEEIHKTKMKNEKVIKDDLLSTFSLLSINIGEYYLEGQNGKPITNFDLIRGSRFPHVTYCYTDSNGTDRKKTSPIEVDHLLRNNNYLIELPKCLHSLKTSKLDPFIPYRTRTDRKLLVIDNGYWIRKSEYSLINDVDSKIKQLERKQNRSLSEGKKLEEFKKFKEDHMKCKCTWYFSCNGSSIVDHVHKPGFKFTANMLLKNCKD